MPGRGTATHPTTVQTSGVRQVKALHCGATQHPQENFCFEPAYEARHLGPHPTISLALSRERERETRWDEGCTRSDPGPTRHPFFGRAGQIKQRQRCVVFALPAERKPPALPGRCTSLSRHS